MQYLSSYNTLCNCNNSNEVFEYLISSLTLTNRTWDYFINWEKVKRNVEQFNIELNILNSLCGSKNIDKDLTNILKKYPQVIKCFPILLSMRDQIINVFSLRDNSDFNPVVFGCFSPIFVKIFLDPYPHYTYSYY